MPSNLFSLVREMATHEACADIIDLADDFQPRDAEVFGGKKSELRESVVRWIHRSEKTEALFQALEDACRLVNDRHHGIEVDFEALRSFQFTEYGPDQHYAAHHQDCGFFGTERQRKLSFSLMLSDPENYEGGDFNIGSKVLRLPLGTMIVFPSIIPHSVATVTEGMRRSLVGWYEGPAWR